MHTFIAQIGGLSFFTSLLEFFFYITSVEDIQFKRSNEFANDTAENMELHCSLQLLHIVVLHSYM